MKLSQVFAFIRRSDDENDQLVPDAQHTPGPTSSRYGANNAHMADQTGSGYEEFFRDSIPCPTCRGLGRIHKDHEHELVAIIPVKDKRLKPRRTYIYVLLALGVCLLTGALLLFFLFPRNVTASHTDTRTLQPHNLVIDTEQKYVSFCIQNPYNITNNNFYSMDITGMQVSLIHDQRVVSKGSNSTILRIPMTSTVEHWVSINITFQGDEAYLVASCMDRRKWVHDVFMQFEMMANYTNLGRSEQTSLTTYQHVSCGNKTTEV